MNILYCSDNNYAPYLGVSVTSVLETNRDAESIVFYVISDGISEDNLDRLQRQVARYGENRRLVLIDGKDWIQRLTDMTMLRYRGSHAANLRLFFTEYIESDVERVLYLDCDTIIQASLKELFETEMGSHPVAVALDSLTAYYKPVVGFEQSDYYFNSGVVLFDVKNWAENNCQQRLIELLRDFPKPYFVNPDQDVLNILLKEEKQIISPKYNFQTTHQVYPSAIYYANYSQVGYYKKEELEEAKKSPVILHAYRFLGQFPWHKRAIHPFRELWWKYVAISEWSDLEPRKNKGKLFMIERILYRLLPKRLFLPIFRKLQSHFFKKQLKAMKQNEKGGSSE